MLYGQKKFPPTNNRNLSHILPNNVKKFFYCQLFVSFKPPSPQTHNKLYINEKKVQLCLFLLCWFFTSESSFGRVVWCKMLYSPNLYFFKLCKHSLYSVHTTQIPPKFFACSPPAIFHYTQEARTHQKCAKMSRNHVFLCHIDNVKNIKRDAAAKGEREKIAKTRQLIFFFFL